MNLHQTALEIVTDAIGAVKPDAAVRRALANATFDPDGQVLLVAAETVVLVATAASIAISTHIPIKSRLVFMTVLYIGFSNVSDSLAYSRAGAQHRARL